MDELSAAPGSTPGPVQSGPSTNAPNVSVSNGSKNADSVPLLKVQRMGRSTDGAFGMLSVNGVAVCESMENLGKEVAEGLYDAVIDKSPHMGYMCPHLRVPDRDKAAGGDAGIRIHIANEPCQLEGCIACGSKRDGDAEDGSKKAFDKMMALLPKPGVPFKVLIYSAH